MKNKISTIAILVLTATLIGGCNQRSQSEDIAEIDTVVDEDQQDFKTLEDRFSYAYGADLAEKFMEEGIVLNVTHMADAMQAVFEGGEMKMDDGEVIATLEIYREVFLKEKEEKRAAEGEKNKKEGAPFLAENARKEGVMVTASGLQYKVITEGDGGYTPTEDDDVIVHYRGTFIDGTEFDSTYKRNQPYSTNAKTLIDGWAEAIQMMSKGAKWELYIPADLAYGELGSDPHIGPNAVLIFEVELLEIGNR